MVQAPVCRDLHLHLSRHTKLDSSRASKILPISAGDWWWRLDFDFLVWISCLIQEAVTLMTSSSTHLSIRHKRAVQESSSEHCREKQNPYPVHFFISHLLQPTFLLPSFFFSQSHEVQDSDLLPLSEPQPSSSRKKKFNTVNAEMYQKKGQKTELFFTEMENCAASRIRQGCNSRLLRSEVNYSQKKDRRDELHPKNPEKKKRRHE